MKKQDIKLFPWWYSYVKWGVPIAATLLVGGLTALSVMGVVPIPASLAALQQLPMLFQNLSTPVAMGLLTMFTVTASTLTGLFAAALTRLALFPIVENIAEKDAGLAFDFARKASNYKNNSGENEDTLKENEGLKKRLAELEGALIEALKAVESSTHDNGTLQERINNLMDQNQEGSLKEQQSDSPVSNFSRAAIFSGKSRKGKKLKPNAQESAQENEDNVSNLLVDSGMSPLSGESRKQNNRDTSKKPNRRRHG